jgi:hypothetical protein
VRPPTATPRGVEVSLYGLGQNDFVQHQIRNSSAPPLTLFLKGLQLLQLIRAHVIVLRLAGVVSMQITPMRRIEYRRGIPFQVTTSASRSRVTISSGASRLLAMCLSVFLNTAEAPFTGGGAGRPCHQACKFGRKQAVEEAGAVLPVSQAIVAFPKHHLSDERDHAVPIILHHCLRG